MNRPTDVNGDGQQQGLREIANDISALGRDLLQAGRVKSAEVQFKKALGLVGDDVNAALGLGHCLHQLGRYAEALVLYDRLIRIAPQSAPAWNNRGNTLLELSRHADAADSFYRVLEINPALHDARVALASCLQALGQVDLALAACDMVLKAAPDHAEAHWNRSLLLLLKGDYDEGWREYEWRWQKRNFTSPRRNFPQPRWQGEPAAGKTILIHAEQGFGDVLQFCRFVALVADRGMRVIFECHPPLVHLMHSLAGVEKIVPMGEPLTEFDLHLPLMSLPLIFDTTLDSVPAVVPYLAPPADRLKTWQGRVPGDRRLKIGLCWAGKGYPDPLRSCPPHALAPLVAIPGIAWYSLQVGWQEVFPFPMNDLTGHVGDFADSAALIAQLDLVITIDTAVAHLAGALGRPTWVMLPHAPDWRWLLKREDTPWYPTMRLFRQNGPDTWQNVVQRIARTLATEFP